MQSQSVNLDPKYRKYVDLLIPYYNRESFTQAFIKTCGHLNKPTQFNIKGELARLFKPYERTIDMSNTSDYDVEEFSWQGKRFYLDQVARRIFLLEVDRFGQQYTQGVYESINSSECYKQFEKQYKYEQAIKAFEVPITPLGLTSRRLEERIFLAKPIFIKPDEGEEIEVFTSNISRSGCLLKVEPFGLVKKGDILNLDFRAMTREFTFDQSPIYKYQVVYCGHKPESDGTQKVGVALCSESFEWSLFLDRYITEHRTRFKVDITNAIDLAESRLVEDHLLKQTKWFPVFIAVNGGQIGNVRHCLVNQHTNTQLNFFHDESEAQRLHSVLYTVWPKIKLKKNEHLLVIRFKKQDKILFIASTLTELSLNNQIVNFLTFAKLFGELAIFELKAFALTQSIFSNLKHNWFTSEKEANNALAPIKNLNHCIMLHRLTEHEKLVIPPTQSKLSAQANQQLSNFICPRLKATNLSLINVEPDCARKELRYFYKTPVIVEKKGHIAPVEANIVDMSAHGLKLHLTKMEHKLEQGDLIQITATLFEKFGELNALNQATYQIVGINPVSHDLHLGLFEHKNSELVVKFMRSLIKSNMTKLKKNDHYDQFILLQTALRTLFITFYPAIAFGVLRDQKKTLTFNRLLVADFTTQELTTLSRLQSPITENRISVYQLINEDKRVPPLIRSIDIFSKNAEMINDELIFSLQPNQVDIPKQSRTGANVRNVQQFVRKTLSQAELHSLYLCISPIKEDNIEHIAEQLNYINRFTPHKAEEIQLFSKKLAGIIEVIDTSDFWLQLGEMEFEYKNK